MLKMFNPIMVNPVNPIQSIQSFQSNGQSNFEMQPHLVVHAH